MSEHDQGKSGLPGLLTERPLWGAVLLIAYLAIVGAALLVAAAANPRTDHGLVYEIGRSFALAGLGVLAMQFVLSARLHWAERPFGLEAVLAYHKAMALLAAALLVMHPLLVALGGPGPVLLYTLRASWHIWFARVALLLLLLQVTASAMRGRVGLGFEQWRLLHNQAALIFGLGAVHGRVMGGDFVAASMQVVWWFLVGTAALAYGHHKIVRPLLARRHCYLVTDVRQETHNVWTLAMKPPPGRQRFLFRPGQFHFLHLRRGRGLPAEEHHFTISSSPTDDALTSTVKAVGDFTATISETKPGDRVAVEGPFGRFSYTHRPQERSIVFIVGGIGITPIMSMLRHMRDTRADCEVVLIYGNRTERDIVFRGELDQIAATAHPRLRVVHVLSEAEESWQGERGFVDREKLGRLISGEHASRMYYVCGPPAMMRKVFADLSALGVPSHRIEFERFAL